MSNVKDSGSLVLCELCVLYTSEWLFVMHFIDGKKASDDIGIKISNKIKSLNIKPKLVVIIVGDDPASKIYVKRKRNKAREVGVHSEIISLPYNTTQGYLLNVIDDLNVDESVHGILVQLPLPKHLDKQAVVLRIDANKDVDCFHIENVGRMFLGYPRFLPCTPAGCIFLIKSVLGSDIAGKHAVVLGRSDIVGKPVSILLLQNDCTVTILHSRSKFIEEYIMEADILVAAVGRQNFVKKVKPGAIVIDVGINRVEEKLYGDVDISSVRDITGYITPVPGGVGPMTVACLLVNTLISASSYRVDYSDFI